MTVADASRRRWSLDEWRSRLRNEPTAAHDTTGDDRDALEEPVRRYLGHAIAPGTPAAHCAEITMRGSIRIGRWLPFRARQILRPHDGFVWAARVAGVIVGSDRYLDGCGGMDWRLAGLVRLAHGDGPDVSRSAAGRSGAEAVWLPTTLLPRLGVSWTAQDMTRITAHYQVGEAPIAAEYQIGPEGNLTSVVFDRWGDPDRTGTWDWHRFGGTFTREATFAGLTVPSAGRLGWHYGTERWERGEFFRYRITDLRPLRPDGPPVPPSRGRTR